MHPLIYLAIRSFVNGVRRAVSTPQRLIGFLFIVGYFYFVVGRTFYPGGSMPDVATTNTIPLPSPQIIETVAWYVGIGAYLLLMLASSVQPVSRTADVDVLFPTPLAPKLVLLFRMAQQYFVTLIMPLLLALVSWRSAGKGLEKLFANMPDTGGLAIRAATLGWLLLAMTCVTFHFALNLFTDRTDSASDRNRKAVNYGGTLLVVLVGCYVALSAMRGADAVDVAHDPLLHIILLPGTATTWIVMGPLSGHMWLSAAGAVVLLGLTLLFVKLAINQVGWMYDSAAVRVQANVATRSLQRRGDVAGLVALRAQQGKVKTWNTPFARRVVRGPLALIWKDLILQTRTFRGPAMIGPTIFAILLPIAVTFMVHSEKPSHLILVGIMGLVLEGQMVFLTGGLLAQTGFMVLLRSGDILKPLPFSCTTIAIYETLAKQLVPTALLVVMNILLLIAAPAAWAYWLAGLIFAPTLAATMNSTFFLILAVFPDVDDPGQRSFRGFMGLLGVVITSIWGLGVFVGLAFVGGGGPAGLIAGAALGGIVNLGVAAVVTYLAGLQYAAFNPSE